MIFKQHSSINDHSIKYKVDRILVLVMHLRTMTECDKKVFVNKNPVKHALFTSDSISVEYPICMSVCVYLATMT